MRNSSLHDLRDMLNEELDKFAKKGELDRSSLDMVDKLTHSVKSIDTILAMDEYSEDNGYSRDGRSYHGNSYDGYSMARGRGRYARRDSRGRYSNDGYSRDDGREEMVRQLRDMMEDAPDERIRQAIHKAIKEVEN